MVKFNGYDITLTLGDSLTFGVQLVGRTLPENTEALFTVRRRAGDEEALLEKRLPVLPDGWVRIELTSEETSLPKRGYRWDLRVLLPEGEVMTPMTPAGFLITEVIGNA